MTSLFIANSAGHLRQLVELADRIEPHGEAIWITNENDQSRSLLAGRTVEFVPTVHPGRVGDVIRRLPHARRLRRESGVTRAISTGSAIALGYLPYLAANGVECHYIESATRVAGPSTSGRVLQRVPRMHLYTQYRAWSSEKWLYRGNIFDAYQPSATAARSDGDLRVVVTLGIATGYSFRRLIEHLIPILRTGGHLSAATGRHVSTLWQTQGTPVDDLGIDHIPTLPAAELAAEMRRADVVISHAGTGSAVAALEQGKCPVLAPRRVSHREIGDEHQHQLAGELSARALARACEADQISVGDLLAVRGTTITRRSPTPEFVLR